jgi:superfamily II DNA or RNA helicase
LQSTPTGLTPLLTWRSRLPGAIGSWFARDLVRQGLALVDAGRVELRTVEDQRIDAIVRDPPQTNRVVMIEWGGGTGPLALRTTCSDGSSGICAHIVATLEAVRSQMEPTAAVAHDADLAWLPTPQIGSRQQRARCIWVVFSVSDAAALTATLVLDSPRLRGAVRDAAAIAAMMDATPADDWDDADRDLLRDEAIAEAFGARAAARPLARALFRLVHHPRVRFDDDPAAGRHPSELPEFGVDLRGVRLLAVRDGDGFAPALESRDDERFSPRDAYLLDGPPSWLATKSAAYLLDGSFDARKVIDVARASDVAGPANDGLSPNTVLRVAPFLPSDERAALGIVDVEAPLLRLALGWTDGALVAAANFVDRTRDVEASYGPLGATVAAGGGFVRFTPDQAADVRARMLAAGFTPRGSDGFALHGADRAAEFVREILPQWNGVEVRLDPGLSDLVRDESNLDISVSALRSGEDREWFDLRIDVFVGGEREPLSRSELDALLATNARFADVRGRLVDIERLRQRRSLLSDLAERRSGGFATLLALRDELHENFGRVELPPEVELLRERLRGFTGIERVSPPQLYNGALRTYQERGLDFLCYLSSFRFGGVLADDMGTGKTIQLISHLLKRKNEEGAAPSLVIAPTSVTHTWENEIARFAPQLRTLRLHSGSERVAKYEDVANADVVITSYALARIDALELAKYRFRTLILDEAQNAKNPSSQIAKVVRALNAEHRIALTGTPIENSLRDLWAIFAFVEPGLLGSETSFRRRFELPIADGDARASSILRSRLEPFVLRRTKEDVAPELPDRVEVQLECDLTKLQRRLYRAVAEAARREILPQVDAQGIERNTIHVLAALTRLRQICAHPGLLFPEHRDDPDASGKFEAFLETVDEVLSGGHRLLVFSAFASMLRLMRTRLDERGVAYGYLDGSSKDRDRNEEVKRFMSDDGPPLFLCSLKAGGVGLTLTAADYVVLYDPWWNPAVERQAIDRTHRIGQHRAVTAYRLVTRGTVEEKIRTLAESKAELSRNVIKVDSAVAKSLTRENLEMLLADPE